MKYFTTVALLAISMLTSAQGVTTWNNSRQLPSEKDEYNEYLTLYRQDNYDQSNKKADSLKNYYASIEDWNSYQFYLNNIIRTMYMMGDYKAAIDKYKADMNLCQHKIDTVTGEYIFGMLNIYSCNNRLRNSEQKYKLAKKLLNTCIKNNKQDSLEFFVLQQITGGLANYEDFEAAYTSLYYAMQIAKENNWHDLIQTTLSTFVGYVTMIDQKNDIALFFNENAFLQNPMKSLRDSLDYITDARQLANSHYKNDNFDRSIEYCEKGLRINEAVSFKKYHDAWYSYLVIALINNYMATDKNEKAYSLSEQVEKLLIKNEDYYHLIYLHLSIANNEWLNSNYQKAIVAADKAKPILDSTYVKDLYFWNSFYNIKSQANYDMGNYKNSYLLAHKGLCNLTNIKDTLVSVDSIPTLNDPYYADQYLELIKLLFKSSIEMYKQQVDSNLHQRIISLFEKYKKIYSIEISENTDAFYVERLQNKYKQILDALTDYYAFNHHKTHKINYNYYAQIIANHKGALLRRQIENSRNLTNSIEDEEIENLKLDILKNESELKIAEINSDDKSRDQIRRNLSELYITLLYKESLVKTSTYQSIRFKYESIDSISKELKPDEAIINVFIADSIMFSNLLTKEGSFIDFDIKKDIKSDFRTYSYAIKTGNSARLITSSNHIYNSFIKSHENNLKKIKTICLIPDIMFAHLPIEALLDETQKPLIERYNISYSYALQLPDRTEISNTNSVTGVLLTAPVSESNSYVASNHFRSNIVNDSLLFRSTNKLIPLPYTKKECVLISKLFKKEGVSCTILLDKQASKANLLKKLKHTQIVHLATHGIINKQNPYISGVLLSPQSSKQLKDNVLYHYELYNMEYLNINLVVLSACQSGVGELLEGEGAMALPRGFICAGVPNVIASLWKVHDEKTKDLMVAFYKHLLEDKVSYAEALRLAKLDCIEKGFLPLDWAGFILIGN